MPKFLDMLQQAHCICLSFAFTSQMTTLDLLWLMIRWDYTGMTGVLSFFQICFAFLCEIVHLNRISDPSIVTPSSANGQCSLTSSSAQTRLLFCFLAYEPWLGEGGGCLVYENTRLLYCFLAYEPWLASSSSVHGKIMTNADDMWPQLSKYEQIYSCYERQNIEGSW